MITDEERIARKRDLVSITLMDIVNIGSDVFNDNDREYRLLDVSPNYSIINNNDRNNSY
jgi:hypothetical protein